MHPMANLACRKSQAGHYKHEDWKLEFLLFQGCLYLDPTSLALSILLMFTVVLNGY